MTSSLPKRYVLLFVSCWLLALLLQPLMALGHAHAQTFTCPTPASCVDINPTQGPRGTSVTATGGNWPAGDHIQALWDQSINVGSATVDSNGNFTGV